MQDLLIRGACTSNLDERHASCCMNTLRAFLTLASHHSSVGQPPSQVRGPPGLEHKVLKRLCKNKLHSGLKSWLMRGSPRRLFSGGPRHAVVPPSERARARKASLPPKCCRHPARGLAGLPLRRNTPNSTTRTRMTPSTSSSSGPNNTGERS